MKGRTIISPLRQELVLPMSSQVGNNKSHATLLYCADTGGSPSDGSPTEITRTFHIGLIVVFDVLATLGIIFAIICFLFNLIYREKKYVL